MLGIPLPLTHRQFLAWQEWLDLQWNRPNRADYYSMRVGQAFAGGNLNTYRIDFKAKEPVDLSKLTRREHKFYDACGNDLLKWQAKRDKVHQNMMIAAIGAKEAQ